MLLCSLVASMLYVTGLIPGNVLSYSIPNLLQTDTLVKGIS